MRVKISVHVPPEYADQLREALGKAGAGKLGEYSFCSFTYEGIGRYVPSNQADPHDGKPGEMSVVNEVCVEVTCHRGDAKHVIAALKKAHPYEETGLEITQLINENEL